MNGQLMIQLDTNKNTFEIATKITAGKSWPMIEYGRFIADIQRILSGVTWQRCTFVDYEAAVSRSHAFSQSQISYPVSWFSNTVELL